MAQIDAIQVFSLDSHDAENIPPLPVRHFSAQAEPPQLLEQNVFGWMHVQRDAAHIHRMSDCGIVVDLTGSVTGGTKCATGVPKATITAILRHPGRYYFNLHNPRYPAGAIRGTLKR